jgi:hypothetical protein
MDNAVSDPDNPDWWVYIPQECAGCDESFDCCGMATCDTSGDTWAQSDCVNVEDCNGICNGPSEIVQGVGPNNSCTWYVHTGENDGHLIYASDPDYWALNEWSEGGCCRISIQDLTYYNNAGNNYFYCPGYPCESFTGYTEDC